MLHCYPMVPLRGYDPPLQSGPPPKQESCHPPRPYNPTTNLAVEGAGVEEYIHASVVDKVPQEGNTVEGELANMPVNTQTVAVERRVPLYR